VDAWYIHQVGTARVIGGVYSCIKGSTHSFPIASRDFAKKEHEDSTLQLTTLRVARGIQREVNYCVSRCRKGREPRFNTPIHEVVKLQEVLLFIPSRRSHVVGTNKYGATPIL
jgi:hypothetical protein